MAFALLQPSDRHRTCPAPRGRDPLATTSMPAKWTRSLHRHIHRRDLLETKTHETAGLIGSDKVEGTNVHDAHGEKSRGLGQGKLGHFGNGAGMDDPFSLPYIRRHGDAPERPREDET